MRQSFILIIILVFIGCKQQTDKTQTLQLRVDSLESRLADAYKPGFGEFMSSIQVHHNKLWFAGENQNWKLADFEIHEIYEAIENIQKYQTERKESQMIGLINPALDSVNAAIQIKSLILFKSGYTLLTTTCNNCHRETGFEFNVVKIPDKPPFSNQDFKLNGAK
jgi:hypothetical protein